MVDTVVPKDQDLENCVIILISILEVRKTRSVKKSQKCIEPAGLLGDASKILEDFTKRVGELEQIKDGWIDPITSTGSC